MPQEKRDYNQTLNLPKTSFDMRAGLPKKEPEFVLKMRWFDRQYVIFKANN